MHGRVNVLTIIGDLCRLGANKMSVLNSFFTQSQLCVCVCMCMCTCEYVCVYVYVYVYVCVCVCVCVGSEGVWEREREGKREETTLSSTND